MESNLMHRLEEMYGELCCHQLVVALVPSKRHDRRDWDCIRVNVDENPSWYKKLCAANASKRGVRRAKFDTIIRRRETLAALERLLAGKPNGTVYESRVMEVAKKLGGRPKGK